MKLKSIITNKTQATLSVFIVMSIFILREYFSGGVISHNLLAREDLPAISNWWGLLTVPLLFWIGISLINRREKNVQKTESRDYKAIALNRFIAGLVFGVLMSLLWEFGFANVLQYLILVPMLIAFFKPVHLPEYLMGFVLGMVFTFGGILPVLIGTILLGICFLINTIIRVLRNLVTSKPK